MKTTALFLGFIFILLAAIATPAGIVFGVYKWVVIDLSFKLSLWAGLKLWLMMLACIIPGMVLYLYGKDA